MKIVMVTNTYLPHVGGVARSVETFAEMYRRKGHQVLVLAPEFDGTPENEEHVLRIPAIQNFNGSDFSIRLPVPPALFARLDEFQPDVIHAHHPFLMGDTALRIAARCNAPIVFTHHTMYERYTHYVPGDSRALKRFVMRLATGYANLCNYVIAPSESIRDILKRRGVDSPIAVVPTGVDIDQFADGDGAAFRQRHSIPRDAFVVGHLGRLAPEKNLSFLAKAVAVFMRDHKQVHFVVVGAGPSEAEIKQQMDRYGVEDRLHLVGKQTGRDLIDSYHSMNLFAFASKTETQGMVLAEAMACGLPVIALDAPGAREVVRNGENGYLLPKENVKAFVKALRQYYELPEGPQAAIKEAARVTARGFSNEVCADKALAVYEKCVAGTPVELKAEDSAWEKTLRLIETEWSLIKNRAEATGIARWFAGLQPLIKLEQIKDRILRAVSRAEWTVRLLKLERSVGSESQPGLVMIQIDGLSQTQFRRALAAGKLPFIRRLLTREGYGEFMFYSGVPATTPAVQGELFYGRKAVVPAFSFVRRANGRVYRMLAPEDAREIESELEEDGSGLLLDGCCYSNIYRGGAKEANFCPSAFGWQELLAAANPFTLAGLLIWHAFTAVRIVVLLALEIILSVCDCLVGALNGQSLLQELKFIPARVAVCILGRELCKAGALLDITRGMPIIHLNLLGYDEQSHRRGPGSYFAHWSLKGIDYAIKGIWLGAKRSTRRDYQVWVYSDHGQEHTESYYVKYGRPVQTAVADIFSKKHLPVQPEGQYRGSAELGRAKWLGGGKVQRLLPAPEPRELLPGDEEVVTTAMGPVGHVYVRDAQDFSERQRNAARLVEEAFVPVVLYLDAENGVRARTRRGEFQLPRDGAELFSSELPYFDELVIDVCELCRHKDAGDYVLLGWCRGETPLSFPFENGAHAGAGPEETRGFAVLPRSHRRSLEGRSYLRPNDLRNLALHFLGRRREQTRPLPVPRKPREAQIIRVMTYNVHSCRGMDGRSIPERIAEVIARYDADIVCLQELDVGRKRSGNLDQAHRIAKILEMDFHFHPTIEIEQELYGDAVLSRLPMKLIRAGKLPGWPGRLDLEPRGALWVEVELDSGPLQILNTHLGLFPMERLIQTHELLGEQWLAGARRRGNVILCADLNASPRSYVYRMIARELADAQNSINGCRPRATWSSRYPLRRLDYVFSSFGLRAVAAETADGELVRRASDHLPVIIDFELPAAEAEAAERKPDDAAAALECRVQMQSKA